MPSLTALSLRICCMAVTLLFAVASAAEPASSLVGSNREQVVRKKGEPRSQIAVGNRVIMLYARERVVLRDGLVVEVEQVQAEPVRRAPPPPVVPTPPAGAAVAAEPATAPATVVAAATPPPANPGLPPPPAASPPAVTTDTAANAAQPSDPAAPKAETPPEPKLEIKLVRPPSANAPRPQAKKDVTVVAPQPKPAPTPEAAPPLPDATAPFGPARPIAASSPAATPPALPASMAHRSVTSPTKSPEKVTSQAVVPPVMEEEEKTEADLAAAAAEKKAKRIKASRRRLDATLDTDEPAIVESVFSTQTYVIAFATIIGSIGFLVWRSKQRRLELEATAVSHVPFNAPISSTDSGAAKFAAEMITKLEWKRFEELVEAYYIKTGVVAVRTKSGPVSPVHIKISWKGEPRPFACVHCIAHPVGLIEVKPLQELYTVLAADDIRRGYVVTTGRFGVAARDFAEEKHLTLLPGDIFLEKLNALPDTARSEIMQAITTGDSSTPSCPKCDAKMVRTKDDPPVWRCASHSDFSLPV